MRSARVEVGADGLMLACSKMLTVVRSPSCGSRLSEAGGCVLRKTDARRKSPARGRLLRDSRPRLQPISAAITVRLALMGRARHHPEDCCLISRKSLWTRKLTFIFRIRSIGPVHVEPKFQWVLVEVCLGACRRLSGRYLHVISAIKQFQ